MRSARCTWIFLYGATPQNEPHFDGFLPRVPALLLSKRPEFCQKKQKSPESVRIVVPW